MGVKVRRKQRKGPYYIFVHHRGRRTSRKVSNSLKVANEVAEIIRGQIATGDYSIFDKQKPVPSFKELSTQWINDLIATKKVRGSTLIRYKGILKNYILLEKIKSFQLQ